MSERGGSILMAVAVAVAVAVALAFPASGVQGQRAGGPAPGDCAGGGAADSAGLVIVRSDDEIRIDGMLQEKAWRQARVVEDFVQGEPVEGAPAEQRTVVRVLFDDEAIYVGARLEEERGRIARQLVRRDETGQADYFEVAFDPNRDRRTGYQFRVSAAGVQRDAYLHGDTREDASWDAVWESEVTADADGWTVELRIPWSQIRYEPGTEAQTWGVNFVRWRNAAAERSYHALVPRNQHGRVSFFRPMEGIRVPASARRIELRPYALALGHTGPAEPGDPFFDGADARARAGLDLRYGLGSAFTLDATINPDFGQVELDPAVINLSAFETFFPEKRPFFVEDARILDFSLAGRSNQLFYSRRIGREPQGAAPDSADYAEVPEQSTILGAAKLTGRTPGGLSIGALAALTGEERGVAAFEDGGSRPTLREFVAQPRAYHGVVRAQQDLRDGATTVGGIATALRRDLPGDRSFDFLPVDAYTAGIDFEHMWGERAWAVEGFLAGSLVRGDTAALIAIQRSSNHYFQRPDSDFSVDSSRTSLAGAAWRLEVERRSGENWTGSVWVGEVTPGFEVNDLGFSRSTEQLDAGARVEYQEIEPGPLFRSYEISLMTFQNWRHEALDDPFSSRSWGHAHKRGSIWLRGQGTFNSLWSANAQVAYRPRTLDDAATRGGPLMLAPPSMNLELGLGSDPRRAMTAELEAQYEEGEAFRSLQGSLELTLRPSSRLEVEMEPALSRRFEVAQYVAALDDPSYEPTYGRRYVFGELERRAVSLETRVNVTFTPDLTLQLFAQPLVEAGEFQRYTQLARPATFEFLTFTPGSPADVDGDGVPDRCVDGTICEADGIQYVDLDGDGAPDRSFADRDFNVVSLRANAVLRWQYRPGSTLYLVWQQRRQDRRSFGDFRFDRDRGDLMDLHPDNVFIVKLNYWLGV